jgi:aminopeptidase YwaD
MERIGKLKNKPNLEALNDYKQKVNSYLQKLCSVKSNRRLGSSGNREATTFFENVITKFGYIVDSTPFTCLDYISGETSLESGGQLFKIFISPYSLGCNVTTKIVSVSSIEQLENSNCECKILLMIGEICNEQLMPKNFVFYNPDKHKKIYSLLENKKPVCIITATERKPELVGAIYPFPLILDGDFDIPNVYCTDKVGAEINRLSGQEFKLQIQAQRIPSTACNIVARINPEIEEKVVICAHIDSYENSPGASDNASGTVVLLLLAEMLSEYRGRIGVEIVAFNGEDHYSAAGQMDYLARYKKFFNNLILIINIDDVGYKKGKTALSHYNCENKIQKKIKVIQNNFDEIIEGKKWFQGDHMIFVQKSIAAIAITCERVDELMKSVTHTLNDTADLIDSKKLVEIARALKALIISL